MSVQIICLWGQVNQEDQSLIAEIVEGYVCLREVELSFNKFKKNVVIFLVSFASTLFLCVQHYLMLTKTSRL